jgi:hypothetical protein
MKLAGFEPTRIVWKTNSLPLTYSHYMFLVAILFMLDNIRKRDDSNIQ